MVYVPAGVFTMGSEQAEPDEAPAQHVELQPYFISIKPVSQQEFARFLAEGGFRGRAFARNSESFEPESGREQDPVLGVTWKAAEAYCRWAGGRLPSEAQWERAARGSDGRRFPWGEQLDRSKLDQPTPVGCLAMVGHQWEWCSSRYATYPYRANDGREDLGEVNGARVIRGGAADEHPSWWRCSNRFRLYPDQDMAVASKTGFRLVKSVGPDPSPNSSARMERNPAPYFQLLSDRTTPVPTPAEDRAHRLAIEAPPGRLLGYEATPERVKAYFIPLERLAELSRKGRRDRFAGLTKLLGLKPGMVIADIGTGSGATLDDFSRAVGTTGQVWATDVSASALQSIQAWMRPAPAPDEDDYFFQRPFQPPLDNVRLVLHDVTDCLLPDRSLDLAYLGQVHYFHYPRARAGASAPLEQVVRFYASIARSLKPEGRMVILDWSENNPIVDPDHGNITADEVVSQMKQAGFELVNHSELVLTSEGLRPAKAADRAKLHSLFIFTRKGDDS